MTASGLHTCFKLLEVRVENARTRTLVLDGAQEGTQPGQYLMAWLPGGGEKPFSIAGNHPLALTVADVGPLSHALCSLEPGADVWARGPLGHGFEPLGRRHLLVGGGYGAAPLAFLAGQLLVLGGEVTVCLGARCAAELLLVRSLQAMGCRVWTATEDGSAGRQGLVLEPAREALLEGVDCVYACGPTGMLLAVARAAREAGVPAQLSFEALMRCGVGLCGSCELPEALCAEVGLMPGWLVCHDGPVARLDI